MLFNQNMKYDRCSDQNVKWKLPDLPKQSSYLFIFIIGINFNESISTFSLE